MNGRAFIQGTGSGSLKANTPKKTIKLSNDATSVRKGEILYGIRDKIINIPLTFSNIPDNDAFLIQANSPKACISENGKYIVTLVRTSITSTNGYDLYLFERDSDISYNYTYICRLGANYTTVSTMTGFAVRNDGIVFTCAPTPKYSLKPNRDNGTFDIINYISYNTAGNSNSANNLYYSEKNKILYIAHGAGTTAYLKGYTINDDGSINTTQFSLFSTVLQGTALLYTRTISSKGDLCYTWYTNGLDNSTFVPVNNPRKGFIGINGASISSMTMPPIVVTKTPNDAGQNVVAYNRTDVDIQSIKMYDNGQGGQPGGLIIYNPVRSLYNDTPTFPMYIGGLVPIALRDDSNGYYNLGIDLGNNCFLIKTNANFYIIDTLANREDNRFACNILDSVTMNPTSTYPIVGDSFNNNDTPAMLTWIHRSPTIVNAGFTIRYADYTYYKANESYVKENVNRTAIAASSGTGSIDAYIIYNI